MIKWLTSIKFSGIRQQHSTSNQFWYDMATPHPLSNYQRNICEYGGLFGVLLSATCLVQHFIAAIPNSITNPMIPAYLLAITSFLLLSLMQPLALYFMMVSAALSLVIEWRYITHYAFSLVVLLLFLYHIVMIVLLYTEQIPQKLQQARRLKQKEEEEWRGKI